MSYINVSWVTKEPLQNDIEIERLKTIIKSFSNKYEADKLVWFENHIRRREDDLFRIGDPICIFKVEVAEAIYAEAVLTHKYRINRESLEELTINIKKILKKKFDCLGRVWIPLLTTHDPEKWKRAKETRNIGVISVIGEKEFDDMGIVTVTFGEIT